MNSLVIKAFYNDTKSSIIMKVKMICSMWLVIFLKISFEITNKEFKLISSNIDCFVLFIVAELTTKFDLNTFE